jgi:hypothetical protein
MVLRKLRAGLVAIIITASALFFSQAGMAQAIKKTATKIGNTTASVAVKGTSKLTDKTYKGKEGPHGETVYIDKRDRKFYVNGKGRKVYLKSSQIRDKEPN